MGDVYVRDEELDEHAQDSVSSPPEMQSSTDQSCRFEILVLEMNRAWSYWLGLPVPPRAWKLGIPTRPGRDEL